MRGRDSLSGALVDGLIDRSLVAEFISYGCAHCRDQRNEVRLEIPEWTSGTELRTPGLT